MQVYFIGAGPGDPELITVKAVNVLKRADIIIYTGSLVNAEILSYAREGVEIYNSASMDLEEVLKVIIDGVREGKVIARVHTGDPSIYGAIQEQIDALRKENIEFKIIPGVSSFLAAAASLEQEYTLPGVTQTVILTRMEGRTPVPEREKLRELAKHRSTMCIFLSVQSIEEVVAELKEGYHPDTPVAVIQKASWPGEKIVRGNLEDIAEKVKKEKITKTALIIVGDVFRGEYEKSRLYAKDFKHGYRG